MLLNTLSLNKYTIAGTAKTLKKKKNQRLLITTNFNYTLDIISLLNDKRSTKSIRPLDLMHKEPFVTELFKGMRIPLNQGAFQKLKELIKNVLKLLMKNKKKKVVCNFDTMYGEA